MVLWMKVSADKYEFPIYIAESQKELARLCGVNRSSISSAIGKAMKKGQKSRYVKVEIEEETQ